jgi:ribosomal protein L24E
MALAKCVFCGVEQEDYLGVYLIRNDGSVVYYSSGKCMKNHLKLKRDKRDVRWTESFRNLKAGRLSTHTESEEKRKIEKQMKDAKKASKTQDKGTKNTK